MNLHIKKWCSIAAFSVPLSLASVNLHAERSTLPWEFKGLDYEGFYIYGQVGHASSDISRDNIEDGLQEIDASIETVWIEESSEAWGAGAGYFFNNWISAELGWLDLGNRSVHLDEDSTFPSSGYDYYPQSGKGLSLGAIGHIPLGGRFYAGPKVGIFGWKDDNAKTDNDGVDLWYGLEFNYRLDEYVNIFAGWQQFDLSRQNVDFFSIGLRYRFGQQDSVEISDTPIVVIDSDGDGIVDLFDQCPYTPKIYQVDDEGCTLFEDELFEYRLVINYANDSSFIDEKYDIKIKELFEFMAEHDIKNIIVEGHTSESGSKSYNEALSLRRAKSVIDELSRKYSLDRNIFVPIGKGEMQLLDKSGTEVADAINRRTEVAVGKIIKREVMR